MDLIINLNKPKGITSHQATTEVKKIFKAKKEVKKVIELGIAFFAARVSTKGLNQ